MTPRRGYGPRPAAERDAAVLARIDAMTPPQAAAIGDMCLRVSRARDGRLFACSRPKGHTDEHYGRDGRGPVRLGYGR